MRFDFFFFLVFLSRHEEYPLLSEYPLLATKTNFLDNSRHALADDFIQQTESIRTKPSVSEQTHIIPHCFATVC